MKKSPQKLLIFGPNLFFSFAKWPKTSLNIIFCPIKMSPSYIMTLISFFSLVFHLHMICTCWHLTTSNLVHFYFVLTKIPSDIYPPSTVTVTMRKEKRETWCFLVMSPSRAEGFSARPGSWPSARNRKLAENEPKFWFRFLNNYFSKIGLKMIKLCTIIYKS